MDFFLNYSFPIIFALFGLFALLLFFYRYGGDQFLPPDVMTLKETLIFVGVIWLLAFGVFLVQQSRLKLEKETLELSIHEVHSVLDEIGKELNWNIVTKTNDVIVADSIRVFSADNRLTILIDGRDVYINARSTGPELSLFRQSKLTDHVVNALRMRNFEIQHKSMRN